MGKAASGECVQLFVNVVLNSPDSRLRIVEQEVRSALIAIVRETNASRIGDDKLF
jgi:hypothetical protein